MPTLHSRVLSCSFLLLAAVACGSEPNDDIATLDVTPTASTLFTVAPGNTATLLVVAKDGDGAEVAVSPTFTSDKVAVATVDGSGVVTAVGPGSATITASVTTGNVTKTATAAATVQAAGTSATVQAPQLAFSPSGFDVQAAGSVSWSIGAIHHNITFTTPGAPANIAELQNSSDSRTFPTSGTYSYMCAFHTGMSGTVRVH